MQVNPVGAAVRHRENLSIIDLSGDVNAQADAEMTRAYTEATSDGSRAIILNFTDVTYINSTGIALIVGLMARARKEGRTMVACGLSDHYKEIFEITRLSDFLKLFDDEESAVGGVPAA